ncbi:MAG: ABC transporter permease [Longimicrobiales bacterium]
MKVIRSLRISAHQLGAHRTRTGLALLGIVIGVSSVIAMVAVGHGARQEVMARIQAMGTELIMVTPAQVRRSAGRMQVRGTVTTLTPRDADALRDELARVVAAAPWASRRMPVKYEGRSSTTNILGVTPDVLEILNVTPAAGGFYTEREEVTGGRTAVLGSTVARALFGEEPPVGRRILIGQVPFEVIGVLVPRGTDLSGADQDDVVMIPLRTALRRVMNQTWLGGIYLRARSEAEMEEAAEQVRWLLRERHRLDRTNADDDFEIQTQADLMAAQQEIGDTFTTLVGGIAAVSLLVGGVGILAIMLISVRERTREIGLRLAVGGRRRDVRTQFLAEAVMLGTGGGAVGVALGLAGAAALAAATDWAVAVEPWSVILSFTFSLLVGVFFGVYPAHRASLLDPVEALRSE